MPGKFDERFTRRARKALMLAQVESQRMTHRHVGTEHMLLGIAETPDGVAGRALADLGVTAAEIRSLVERITDEATGTDTRAGYGLTDEAKRTIEAAVEEVRRRGGRYVGTQHLLLAMIRQGRNPGANLLRDLQVDVDALRVRMAASPAEVERGRRLYVTQAPEMIPEMMAPRLLKCGACGRDLLPMWSYCPFCGTASPGHCTSCHARLPDDDDVQYCPYCGTKT
jgi:hypothetical protein